MKAAPIVVGTLDPSAETALLEYAGRLAAAGGHPLRLVHVVRTNALFGDPVFGLPGAMQPRSMMIDDSAVGLVTEQLLHDAIAIARKVVDGTVEVTGELKRGHVAHVLIEESRNAHRVVLQRRRFSRTHRVFTGSTSSRVSAHAHCPVTVVPEGWSPEGRSGVVVGVSHDKSDDQLVSHALDAAARVDEPVTVLHGELADHDTVDAWMAYGERYLADLIRRVCAQTPDIVRPPGAQVIGEAPADALVTASETARLVVVGRSAHLNAYPHLGGVTRALLREAACPVEVVPLPG